MTNDLELSIVSTIYNDASIVAVLVDQIQEHATKLKISYEIVLVDDCSTDESENEIKTICKRYENVKGLTLARNFGQQIAISAGIRYAIGKYVVIMDGDLQNPPSEIPTLYNEIKKGYDVVYTISSTRNNIFNEFSSKIFWLLLTKLFGVEIIENQLMMKIMTQDFVRRFNNYNEINRTVSGIVRDISSNYQVLKIENAVRTIGKSHYSFFSRVNLFIDILISLSNAPLNIMIYFGWLIFHITIILCVYYLFNYFYSDVPAGFTSIILSIFFFGSLIVLLLGFIGRYLSNIYTEVRNRPLFHVQKHYNILFPTEKRFF